MSAQGDGMPVIERWWRVTRPHDGHVTWTPEDPSDRLHAAWEGAPVEGPFVPEAEVERLREALERMTEVDDEGIPLLSHVEMYQLAADVLDRVPNAR